VIFSLDVIEYHSLGSHFAGQIFGSIFLMVFVRQFRSLFGVRWRVLQFSSSCWFFCSSARFARARCHSFSPALFLHRFVFPSASTPRRHLRSVPRCSQIRTWFFGSVLKCTGLWWCSPLTLFFLAFLFSSCRRFLFALKPMSMDGDVPLAPHGIHTPRKHLCKLCVLLID
jgi:hypothetical protein